MMRSSVQFWPKAVCFFFASFGGREMSTVQMLSQLQGGAGCLPRALPLATKRRCLGETQTQQQISILIVSPSRRYENTRRAAQTHFHEMSLHSLRCDLTYLWRTLKLRLDDTCPLSPRCRTEQLPTPARKQIQERPTHGCLANNGVQNTRFSVHHRAGLILCVAG
jgi:hypothetical protein